MIGDEIARLERRIARFKDQVDSLRIMNYDLKKRVATLRKERDHWKRLYNEQRFGK